MRDWSGEVVRPLKELKGWVKVNLEPGEMTEVSFTLQEEQLRYHHADLQYKSDAGRFGVYIGSNSRDVTGTEFRLLK
ncbi:Periplasmic beta-glucosidase precursor [compost metagenome]